MIAVVCGDRNWTDRGCIERVLSTLAKHPDALLRQVITGGCSGVDRHAYELAGELGIGRVEEFAKWRQQGRAAGPIRNRTMMMTLLADIDPEKKVIAFHDNLGESRGTMDMMLVGLAFDVGVWLYRSDGSATTWTG